MTPTIGFRVDLNSPAIVYWTVAFIARGSPDTGSPLAGSGWENLAGLPLVIRPTAQPATHSVRGTGP